MRCSPNLVSIPGSVDGVVIATHPKVSIEVVRQCLDRGITRVWFHRSFGQGRVSEEAVRESQSPRSRLHCRRLSAHVLRTGRSMSPAIILRVVDFPDPLGPSNR